MFHGNHGPILHRFQDKRRFQSKMINFPHPLVYCMGSLSNLVSAKGAKKLEWWAIRQSKYFNIGLAV